MSNGFLRAKACWYGRFIRLHLRIMEGFARMQGQDFRISRAEKLAGNGVEIRCAVYEAEILQIQFVIGVHPRLWGCRFSFRPDPPNHEVQMFDSWLRLIQRQGAEIREYVKLPRRP